MTYKGIGFNGPHLAAMPLDKFKREVAHHLSETEAEDLYRLLQLKYLQQAGDKTPVCTSNADDNIIISKSSKPGFRSGDSKQS